MKFMHAVWYLRTQGIRITASARRSKHGAAFYKVWDPGTTVPAMWCLPTTVCSLAAAVQAVEKVEANANDLADFVL